MRIGNIAFLPQGYSVLRNRGHDILTLVRGKSIFLVYKRNAGIFLRFNATFDVTSYTVHKVGDIGTQNI